VVARDDRHGAILGVLSHGELVVGEQRDDGGQVGPLGSFENTGMSGPGAVTEAGVADLFQADGS